MKAMQEPQGFQPHSVGRWPERRTQRQRAGSPFPGRPMQLDTRMAPTAFKESGEYQKSANTKEEGCEGTPPWAGGMY